jgi:hypothetical protein
MIQILEHLLLSAEENIAIHLSQEKTSIQNPDPNFKRPSVFILQTCKQINEEGTPILYGHHTFTILLRKLLILLSIISNEHSTRIYDRDRTASPSQQCSQQCILPPSNALVNNRLYKHHAFHVQHITQRRNG